METKCFKTTPSVALWSWLSVRAQHLVVISITMLEFHLVREKVRNDMDEITRMNLLETGMHR